MEEVVGKFIGDWLGKGCNRITFKMVVKFL
jgi:hypothetical protein